MSPNRLTSPSTRIMEPSTLSTRKGSGTSMLPRIPHQHPGGPDLGRIAALARAAPGLGQGLVLAQPALAIGTVEVGEEAAGGRILRNLPAGGEDRGGAGDQKGPGQIEPLVVPQVKAVRGLAGGQGHQLGL